MREIRLSGSEGGGSEINRFSLPLFLDDTGQPDAVHTFVTFVAKALNRHRGGPI